MTNKSVQHITFQCLLKHMKNITIKIKTQTLSSPVCPRPSSALTLEPCLRSSSMMSQWPLSAHTWSGVRNSLFFSCSGAPFLSRASTMPRRLLPVDATAQCCKEEGKGLLMYVFLLTWTFNTALLLVNNILHYTHFYSIIP